MIFRLICKKKPKFFTKAFEKPLDNDIFVFRRNILTVTT